MLAAQQRIFQRISENPRIRTVVSEMMKDVLQDPEFQQLATGVLRDVFVDNERLAQTLEQKWNSEEAKRALEITNARLDATVTRIGQTLFGAPDTSITPEFSRVLRNRILYKDDRWLELHLVEPRSDTGVGPEKIPAVWGQTGTENPFHVPHRSPF
jgi:hypothetical protein